MLHNALIHDPGDDVAVVVVDLKAGEVASAVTLEGQPSGTVTAVEDIPLGHKIAMRPMAVGKDVIKYRRNVGKVYREIRAGQHVHTQNIRSERWQR